ncbi:MAG TPA: D-alanine--D-alanine ligase [Bacillota bacterium]|jgi:D-alanine-D-alanine ligase
MGLTVGLLYNLGKYEPPEEDEPPDIHAELDSEKTVLAIADALRWGGHEVIFIEATESAYQTLRHTKIDIAFNIAEGLRGESRESHVPAMLEMLGIPYAGSNVLSLALSLDKPMAKRVFAYHRIPTAKFEVIEPGQECCRGNLHFPLFVKPAREGSSIGVSTSSVVQNGKQLREQVIYIHRYYQQAALVEEFLDGREFTVGLLGNHDHHFFPITEINFSACPEGRPPVYDYEFKRDWDAEHYYLMPAPLAEMERDRLCRLALVAFKAMNCSDIGRVDIRLDRSGVPHVIEINPLPGLAPGFSDLPKMADAEGMSYNQLINGILDAALERYGLLVAADTRAVATA